MKAARRRVCVALVGLAVAAAPAARGQEVHTLALDEPVERLLASGETHTYVVAAASGEFVRVVVDPRGAEVKAELTSPQGEPIAQVDRLIEDVHGRTMSWIATRSGEHRLVVSCPFKGAPRGPYRLQLVERRPAETPDADRVAAERAGEEAARLYRRQEADTSRKAIARYEESVARWRASGDRQGEALARLHSTGVYRTLNEYAKALETLDEALRLWRGLGDRRGEAVTLNAIGQILVEMAEYPRALEHYRQALELETGFRKLEASVLNNIGAVHRRSGDFRAAQEHYRRAVAAARELGERGMEATVSNNLGLASQRLGEYQPALEAYGRALALFRELGSRDGEGMALNNLALAYMELGLGERAVEVLEQAVQLRRAAGNRAGEAIGLANLGNTYRRLGQPVKALAQLQPALEIYRSLDDRAGQAVALRQIGAVHEATGDLGQALDHFAQSFALSREVGNRAGEAGALQSRARVRRAQGEHAASRDDHREALRLYQEGGDRDGEASSLLGLAEAERSLGRVAEALAAIESAIQIVEELRSAIASTDLRATYQAARQDYYQLHVELLMQLERENPGRGHAARALQVSERARSRSLLDLLTEAQVDLRQGADPGLVERERMLTAQINAQEARRRQLMGSRGDAALAAAAGKELVELLAQYRDVQAAIRAKSPRYAALTQPQPLTLAEIQERLLDADTLLLEYKLGRDRSFLWAATRTGFRSAELPPGPEIDAAARRVAELILAARDPASAETPAQRSRRRARVETEYRAAAARLSRLLLGPVADMLNGQRLVVVADGALHYVPFGALPVPQSAAAAVAPPLLVHHEVVALPSASVLAVLRHEQEGRAPAEQAVAVLADPVFAAEDVRLPGPRAPAAPPVSGVREAAKDQGALERSARDAGLDGFPRLRFSRDEALAISRLVPSRRALSALDFRASRDTALSPEIGRYRVVHFATHGMLNTQHPELSGLVLSLVDERGRPKDGFLRLHEVYGLKWSADLVVLSGCETALGKEIRGEGLVGLTRGFMYAGAPRVIASLWNVNDRATAKLMGHFYEGMLGRGLRPAAALREAQVEMWKRQPGAVPHLWAAFVLQGEWR